MVHKFPYRLSSLLMALFILISSTGMSLNIHYCGDELYDYAFIGEVNSCKVDDSNKDDHSSKIKDAGCCSFDHFKIETSDNYKFSEFDKESLMSLKFSFVSLTAKTFIENSIPFVVNRIYPPPPKIKNNNLYLQKESLLI